MTMTEQEWLGNNQLSLDIWHNKYQYGDESFEEWLDRVSSHNSEIKRLIREKKFLFGGRTLANRGVPNSGSFSNCYSIGYVPDSLDGIMDVAHKIAMTFKAQGGQGLSLSKIRPKGSLINGQYPSDGIVPFMNIFNTVTESVSQGGSRKGALMMSIDAWHPEAETFIKIKEDLNKINKANLSVEVDDHFMRYINDEEAVSSRLTDADDERIIKVNPKHIFDTICKSAWKSAEPGILFTDRLRNYNLMEFVDDYQIETTNPCGEQPLPKHGACNLCSINVSEYVLDPWTDNARIDYLSLKNDLEVIVSEMDKVLEENANRHALPEQKEMSLKYRNIGIGIMGLADLFVKMGIRYGDSNSIGVANFLMKFIFRESVIISAANGRVYGSFPGYDPKIWNSAIIKNTFTKEEVEELRKQNTLRNCSLLSIAPTGSIGTMLNISTGVEPFFALSYTRRTESMSGETYKVEIKAVEEYRKACHNNEDLPEFFITSAEIPWKQRIDIQAALQEFCDTAISSTVNLSRETTIEDVKELYKYAWKKGLKGVTIYREGSRDPILSIDNKEKKKEVSDEMVSETLSSNTENAKLQLEANHEFQRGEIIPTSNHWLGLKRKLITGCGSLHVNSYWDPETGELRECYLSKGSAGGCQNFMIGLSRMISLAARGGVGIEAILDQLKSCGTCPSYAVRQATQKDCSKGSCCPVAVGNALKDMYNEIQEIICECKEGAPVVSNIVLAPTDKPALRNTVKPMPTVNSSYYTTAEFVLEECPNCHEKTLIHTGGCVSCSSCSWTKCN